MSIRDNLGGSAGAVLDTLEEIEANTEEGKSAGALALKELSNKINEWKKIDVNFKASSVTTNFATIGTFPELIEAKEFLVDVEGRQFYAINTNDIIWIQQYLKTNSTATNECEFTVQIDATTGVVKFRQPVKASAAAYRIFKSIYYR